MTIQLLIQRNVQDMESYALPIFRAGHTPILGEWLALPWVELAGSKQIGDEAFNEVFHPIAVRLLQKCAAVLRVVLPREPMKWYVWDGALGCGSITVSRRFKRTGRSPEICHQNPGRSLAR